MSQTPDTTPCALSIVIPVRNEGINLKIMFKLLTAVVEVPYEVVVVYDDPQDETIPVIEELSAKYDCLKGVQNTLGKGVINALKAGVEASRGDYVLIFAADEVGPVLAIDDMLDLMEGGCDFVACTRYAHGGRRLGGSRIGHFLSLLANNLFNFVAGGVMTDSTTGIKLFRREIFPRFELSANPVGWAVAFEMAIKAQVLGLRIGEVPIVSIDRLFGGTSTFRLGSWIVEYSQWFWWGFKELRKAKRKMKRSEIQVKLPSRSVEVR